jgi:hypothetical protein
VSAAPGTFLYTVSCRIGSAEGEAAWLDWLRRAHIAEVIACGALSADIVRRDGEERAYDIHYRFRDRAACDAYLRSHAPRLREAGAQLFPPEEEFAYSRATGEIVFSL